MKYAKEFNEISEKIYECKKCPLHKGIRNYVPGVLGEGFMKLVLVGEAAGRLEDISGKPFMGRSGDILAEVMAKVTGLKRSDYCLLNVLKCHPPDNRDPTKDEKKACRPWLIEQLKLIKPYIIVTLGRHASQSLLGDSKTMGELRESWFEVEGEDNMHILPTWHPMATAYVKARKSEFEEDMKLIRKVSDHRLARDYTKVRTHERCALPFNEQKNPDGYGIILS